MRRKTVLAVLMALAAGFMLVYSMRREPHDFSRSECPECHAVDSSGAVAGKRLTAPLLAICERCHAPIFDSYLHPVEVRPLNATVPADMPLSQSGTVTCSTCHDIHRAYATPYGAPSYYLRRDVRGREFCRICHRATSPGMRGHAESLGESHFLSKYIVTDPSQGIDAMSKNCISCHDGSSSTSATIQSGMWVHGRDFLPYDRGSHPIGVAYEAARLRRGRKTDLLPLGMVDRRIRFFDGKVGCGSCHDPYSAIEKKLVMSDRGSKLCLACHLVAGR